VLALVYHGFARWLPASRSFHIIGRISTSLRAALCSGLFDRCERGVNVEHGVEFGSGRGIVLRRRACLGVRAQILGEGGLEVGRDVMMGPDVTIVTQGHGAALQRGFDGFLRAKVTIEQDAWIGTRAVILKGVRIGRGAIVGAGAVVSKDVPPFAVVGGAPARELRKSLIDPALVAGRGA
jgi:maltose O-acetyltransferase